MSYISFDNFVEVNFSNQFPEKKKVEEKIIDKLTRSQREHLTQMKMILSATTEHRRNLQTKGNFLDNEYNDSKKTYNKIKEMREANVTQGESVEASLKSIDMSYNVLHFAQLEFKDNSAKAIIQNFYDANFLDIIHNTDENLQNTITFNKR